MRTPPQWCYAQEDDYALSECAICGAPIFADDPVTGQPCLDCIMGVRPGDRQEGGMSYWADTAHRVIQEVHMRLPERATLAERQAAVDAAYPFGERAYSPYKTWLRARREYLCRFGYQPKGKPHGLC